jgi:hypothetical protein
LLLHPLANSLSGLFFGRVGIFVIGTLIILTPHQIIAFPFQAKSEVLGVIELLITFLILHQPILI